MINLGLSIGLAALIIALMTLLKVHLAISIPIGLIAGFILFIYLGRKIQVALEAIMMRMQKEAQAGKYDRAIEILKSGYAFKNRHIFIEAQINAQIGMLLYIQKKHDEAYEYLKKSFLRNFMAQGMLACIHFKRKNYDEMKTVMNSAVQANKKESMVYSLYAYFLSQTGEKDKAIEMLQKGLKKLPSDDRLNTNLVLLQNNKKMKMRVYGDVWVQFMLDRPPRVMQQPNAPHMRMRKKAMFR